MTTTTECANCQQPTRNLTGTCNHCHTRIRHHLHTISHTWTQSADPTLTPRQPTTRTGTGPQPLPGGTSRLDWRTRPPLTLTEWAEDWTERLTLTQPPPRHTPTLCEWLTNHLDAALTSYTRTGHPEAIQEFTDTLQKLARMGAYHAGETIPRRPTIPCPECATTQIPIPDDTPGATSHCRNCDTTYTRANLKYAALNTATDVWVGIDDAATWTGKSASTIRRMARKGQIPHHLGRFNIARITEPARSPLRKVLDKMTHNRN